MNEKIEKRITFDAEFHLTITAYPPTRFSKDIIIEIDDGQENLGFLLEDIPSVISTLQELYDEVNKLGKYHV